MRKNARMRRSPRRTSTVTGLWALARSGDYRGGASAARDALRALRRGRSVGTRVELHLIVAFCSMRQGHHSDALRELANAGDAAASLPADDGAASHVDAWRAELA